MRPWLYPYRISGDLTPLILIVAELAPPCAGLNPVGFV
jgi:hypothetical protein